MANTDGKDSNELAKDRTEQAEDRTHMAEDRTIMANERTFAGWLRTGLACIGIGLGFRALFGKIEPSWMPKLIATAFMVMAILIFIAAYRRAQNLFERLDAHSTEEIPRGNMRLITGVMCLGAFLCTVGIWYFDWMKLNQGA